MKDLEMKAYRIIFNNKGFTLLEILIAIIILGIAIVPMLNAFTPSIKSIGIEEETMIFTNQVRGTLNRLAGLDFAELNII